MIAGARAPLGLAMAATVLSGLAHGGVHAAEAPGAGMDFLAGMILATGLLHVAGMAVGAACARLPSRAALAARVAGAGAICLLLPAALPALTAL
jgi:urease accessory protein